MLPLKVKDLQFLYSFTEFFVLGSPWPQQAINFIFSAQDVGKNSFVSFRVVSHSANQARLKF